MDKDKIIDGLKMTMELCVFDPSTGEEIEPHLLNDISRATYDACKGALEILERLDTDSDTISRAKAIDICRAPHMRNADCSDFEMAIMMLPPAQPKRGRWIDKGITGDWQYQTDGRGRSWHEWQCDQCKDMVKKRSFYCPNCGAKMEVTE